MSAALLESLEEAMGAALKESLEEAMGVALESQAMGTRHSKRRSIKTLKCRPNLHLLAVDCIE